MRPIEVSLLFLATIVCRQCICCPVAHSPNTFGFLLPVSAHCSRGGIVAGALLHNIPESAQKRNRRAVELKTELESITFRVS